MRVGRCDWSRRSAFCLLTSLGVAVSGCGKSDSAESAPAPSEATGGSAPTAAEPPISIEGRWGLFVFEDPIAVELVQTGSQLSGLGCDSGLPTGDYNPRHELCAPLVGAVEGNRAWFEFALLDGGWRVRADVTIAADASRLSGSASFGSSAGIGVALLPFSEDELWLPFPNQAERPFFSNEESFELREASGDGSDFQPDRVYELHRQNRGMWGDFGVFWHTEMSSASDAAPIQVGPVSATAPAQPISLTLEQDGGVITRIVAVMESGASYLFGPAAR